MCWPNLLIRHVKFGSFFYYLGKLRPDTGYMQYLSDTTFKIKLWGVQIASTFVALQDAIIKMVLVWYLLKEKCLFGKLIVENGMKEMPIENRAPMHYVVTTK